ncbi:MAG: polynucleotide adenylyltransferase, partial [Clostridia bacterium]|nr:polynucleotide adenylyltransferase [Clostridia bacterium]
ISAQSCFTLSNLEINGSTLIENGFEKGKKIGDILSILLSEVIENKLPNEKNALLKRAKEIYSQI